MTTSDLRSLASVRADDDFQRAMAVPEALLAVRHDLPNKQWRERDLALNRSVVVLTVAAWQAWVETYVSTALDTLQSLESDRPVDTEGRALQHAYGPLIDLARQEVKRFSTPNASGVRQLLRLLGDDPRPRWSFESVGGQRDPNDVVGRLNDWLKIRHAIAHGAPHLPAVDVLQRTADGNGSLTHRHATHCIAFFRSLVIATGHPDEATG